MFLAIRSRMDRHPSVPAAANRQGAHVSSHPQLVAQSCAGVPDAPAQVERDLYCLARAGYVVLRDIFDEWTTAKMLELGGSFEDEVEEFVRGGGSGALRHSWPLRTTRALYAIAPVFQDAAMHAVIQSMARAYLGDFVVRDCLMQSNMPDVRNQIRGRNGDLSFHRDTIWPAGEIEPRYLHAFILLHDFSEANGATVVVPGTHREREPGYYFKDSDPRGSQPGIDYRVYERRYFPSATTIEAPRGSLVFLDPMVIHTQGINTTAHKRSLINVTLRRSKVRGTPPLLNARRLAECHARVPVRPDLLELLEASPWLPASFGTLGGAT
jgi:ectoine hydroxylase-related dioxygenase (phytanoyl-CoA dioxygenase family)